MGQIRMQVPRKRTREIGVRNGDGLELTHVPEDHVEAAGVNRSVGNGKISEVNETREPDTGKAAERANAGEGSEGKREIGREADGGSVAVGEGERTEGREGLERCEGDGKVGGAVRKVEGHEVAEGLGVVADGGVVRGRLDAGVPYCGDVEGLESFYLFGV